MARDTSALPLTDGERTLVRRAALGVLALVSRADPGFFGAFAESMAGSRALQEAPADLLELLTEGPFPEPRSGSPEEMRRAVLADLTGAMEVLTVKAPDQAEGFRQVVLAAADRVAAASQGVSAEERSVIRGLREALGPEAPAAGV